MLFSLWPCKTLLCGDFNGHHPNWSCKNNSRGLQIYEAATDYNYVSLNTGEATRCKMVLDTWQKSSPDVTFVSSDVALRFSWNVFNENLASDHLMIFISTEIESSNFKMQKRNFKKADWIKYREILTELINNKKLSGDPQQAYNIVLQWIDSAAKESIPVIKLNTDPTSTFRPKPYWCADLSRAVALRRQALAQLRRNPTPVNLSIFKRKTAEAQCLIRKAWAVSFKQFCHNSDLWNKMKWLKGHRIARNPLDYAKTEKFLTQLTPDYVLPPDPIFNSSNLQLEAPISVQEHKNTI